MTTGLIVGKFAPFHQGHEHLLNYAYAIVDTLVVLLYDVPDVTRVPLSVRADWIRASFSKAIILEGYDAPPRGVWNAENMRAHEEFIVEKVGQYDITHVFSGEEYGGRLSEILGAQNMPMEKLSAELPLSASMLRHNPALYERYVADHICNDLKRYGDIHEV